MSKKDMIRRINNLDEDYLRLALIEISNGKTLKQALQRAEEHKQRIQEYRKEAGVI